MSDQAFSVVAAKSPFDSAALTQSRIPANVFAARFLSEKQKHPFSTKYLGVTNPYTGCAVNSEADYYEYLREHTYYMLCDELVVQQTEKIRETSLVDVSSLQTQNESLKTSYQDVSHKHRRLRRISFVLLALLIASGIGLISRKSSDSALPAERSLQASEDLRKYDEGYEAGKLEGYQSGKDDGYASGEKAGLDAGYQQGRSEGYSSGKSDGYSSGYEQGREEGYSSGQSDGYSSGYQEGKSEGYSSGKSDGYSAGYDAGKEEGYSSGYKAGKRAKSSSSGSGSSGSGNSSSSSGSSREAPIANAYIGNKNSKKFHRPTCSYLPNQENQVTFSSRDAAIAAGYDPCGRCNP